MSSPSDPKAKQRIVVEWSAILKQALDADTWGQALEAVDEYEKLTRILDEQIPTLQLSNDERSSLLKLRYCVNLRATSLQDLNNLNHAIKLEDCKLLPKVLENVFIKPIEFPVTLDNYNYALENKGGDEPTIQGDQAVEEKTGGSLKPPAKVKAGLTTIELYVDKIGLKDAQSYIQSHLTVLVCDTAGKEVIETQTTPNTNKLKPNYVTFGETIHIQTPVEEIAKGYVIFFEFKHYKPKKKKISTRCFCFMEYEELIKAKGTTVCLELYKKPTDLTRKKINLFTIKPLYLHVRVVFNKH